MSDSDGTIYVEMEYPRNEDSKAKCIVVGLSDVRAADDILIEYDFERDGYVIKQASKFVWRADDPVCDQDWQEVAFVEAWAREDKDWLRKITGDAL